MAAVSSIIAATGLAVAAAGVGVSVIGQREQSKAAKKAAEFNAAVERNNSIIAQQEGQFAADRIRKRNRLLLSRQRASYAKGGVTLDATPEDVITDSAIEGELDALAALYTGDVRATSAQARSELASARADAIGSSIPYNTASTILTGTGSIATSGGNLAARIENRT